MHSPGRYITWNVIAAVGSPGSGGVRSPAFGPRLNFNRQRDSMNPRPSRPAPEGDVRRQASASRLAAGFIARVMRPRMQASR